MNLDLLRNLWQRARALSPRWLRILGCSVRDFVVDNGPQWSAAVAFYSILSLFPLALAGISIAAWFIDPQWAVGKASDLLGQITPRAEPIREIIGKAVAARGPTGLLSIVLLLWTGSRVVGVLIRALNIACDVDETSGFFRRLFVELSVLLSVGVLFIAALVADLLGPLLGSALESLPVGKATTFAVLRWTLPALLLAVGFFGLYKFVPRHRCNWQSALLGSLTATALILGARPLFTMYVDTLAGYQHIYGWLAIGIVLLVWAQILAALTLFCGELASHIQMMAYNGLSGEEVGRRHRVRSPMRTEGRERG